MGTYPLSLGVRMRTAGCRKGSDPTPSAVPIFSNGIEEGSLVAVRPVGTPGAPTGRVGVPQATGLQALRYLLWPF